MLLRSLLLCCQSEAATLVFADRYDQAFAEAAARNVPVLVVDFDGWTTDTNQGQWTAFFEDKGFLAQAESAVLVLGSQEQHGEKKQLVDGVERTVCSRFGSVSCTAHRDLLPKIFADFGEAGELRSPLFGIALPDHQRFERLEHEQTPATIANLLKQAQKKLGDGLKRADWLRLDRGAKEIAQFVASRDHASAVALCTELRKIPGNQAPQRQIAALEKQLDEAGSALAAKATKAWETSPSIVALLDLEEVSVSFAPLPCSKAAAATLRTWEKSPAAAPHLAALKNDRSARQLLQQATEAQRKGDLRRARSQLERLIASFPETRSAPPARKLLDRFKG